MDEDAVDNVNKVCRSKRWLLAQLVGKKGNFTKKMLNTLYANPAVFLVMCKDDVDNRNKVCW